MITEFAKLVGVLEEDILGISRIPRVVEARQMYHFILKQAGFSFSEIGRLCGVNHATVIHSIKKVEMMLEIKDKIFTTMYEQVKSIKR